MTRQTIIIAEAGVNHNGSRATALQLIDAASAAGADIVKFQTFEPRAMVSEFAPQASYQTRNIGVAETQSVMLERLKLLRQDHGALLERCQERNIEFLSTPFDEGSIAFLAEDIGVRRIKLGSGEVTAAPILLAAARTGLPVILSTGMANLGEIETALSVIAFGYLDLQDTPSRRGFASALARDGAWDVLRKKVTLLHCTTDYPTAPEDANLRAMATMSSAFGLPVGYSDHTLGLSIATAAVALGAVMIEKHFTLDRDQPGPDHRASLEPGELSKLVTAVRVVETALGDGKKEPRPTEISNIVVARKSIVAARPIASGEVFSQENITVKRPGNGRSPLEFWDLMGTRATRAYLNDEPIE